MSSDEDQGFSWGGGEETSEPCSYCDLSRSDGEKFCRHCGQELGTLTALMNEPVWCALLAIAGCAVVVALAMR